MSSALVKKSLELFEDDLKTSDVSSDKKKKKIEDPMTLISTNRKGVKKELRRLQKSNKKKQSGKRHTWSALEMYDYSQSVDHTEASVKTLQRISQSNRKDLSTAEVILSHRHGKMPSKKKTQQKDLKEESTVFTETDFKNFEKEFFS